MTPASSEKPASADRARELARRHLDAVAREPRPAGGEAERRARAHCTAELRALGFTVCELPFEYSAWPGRWATPAYGAVSALLLAIGGHLGAHGRPGSAMLLLALAGALLALVGRSLSTRGVLDLPWARAASVNVEATRGGDPPPVWLVAHLDSKSQPAPMALRVAGIVASALAWAGMLILAGLAATGRLGAATAWPWWMGLTLLGAWAGLPLILSTVGARSAGAVDNASGVATVLAAAALLSPEMRVGVLLTSAEELGLAGARAWARLRGSPTRRGARQPAGIAINCDGVDDAGRLSLMSVSRAPIPTAALRASARDAGLPLAERGVPGILVDAIALHAIGFQAVTLMKGTTATLRRVHTPADGPGTLTGAGVAEAAVVMAGAVERLQQAAPAGPR